LWDAARHIITPTGNLVNMPTAFETFVGRQVSEAGPVTQTNPTFGNVQWSDCPTWSSDEILTSAQLAQDCGVGTIVDVLRDIFTIRIKLGLGQTFTNTLLSNAHVGVTTASSSAITPAEVMSLPTKVSNAMYAYQPTSGWLMAAGTLEYVYALVGTDGLRIFRKEFDDEGYPLLLKQRVYLSPTFPAIGASNSVMAFGDLNRYHIREVADSFTLFRYDETYMPNHQYGWQAWLRADGKLISADAGASDFPIVLLQNHA
jgi:HK97 family phage major capsid protein